MSQGYRPDRVGDQIRQELSEMLTRGDIHDPGIGFITLTRVAMSPDLQIARIYYTSLGDEKARKETSKALDRATPYMRRQVGGRLRLRRVPEFEFRFDRSIEHQDRIEQIIRDLHEHPPTAIETSTIEASTSSGSARATSRDDSAQGRTLTPDDDTSDD